MALQVSSFICILQHRFCCSASSRTATTKATATATATATAAAAITTTAAAAITTPAPAPATVATTTTTAGARESDSFSYMADFLVDSLELSEQQALSASAKLTKLWQYRGAKVCRPNRYRNAHLVISFLRDKGLEKPQIQKLISSVPVILTCRVETNLEPKLNYFSELGSSVSDFADIILAQPLVLNYAMNSIVRPAIEDFREILGSNENVVRVLKRFGLKLTAIRNNLVRNVSFLRARGVPLETIQKRILLNASPFVRRHEVFKDKVAQVEVKWGVSPRSAMYLLLIHVLCCFHERTIESKFRVFESFGWDRSLALHLFRRNPHCLCLGARNIKTKLSFFMNELGYNPGQILIYRSLLCYSLEKRVMPRYLVFQVLQEKGLIKRKRSFARAISHCEDKFLGKFVIPFLDDVPDLLDMYVNSIKAATKAETTLASQE